MDAVELVRTDTDLWNARDEEAYLRLFTEDCEPVAPGFTGKGPAGGAGLLGVLERERSRTTASPSVRSRAPPGAPPPSRRSRPRTPAPSPRRTGRRSPRRAVR